MSTIDLAAVLYFALVAAMAALMVWMQRNWAVPIRPPVPARHAAVASQPATYRPPPRPVLPAHRPRPAPPRCSYPPGLVCRTYTCDVCRDRHPGGCPATGRAELARLVERVAA